MKAIAYARFSSDHQREESIDAQIRAIKYYAAQYGYDIVGIYADRAKSGRSSDRPQFLQMIQDSAKGTFSAVIVHKLDRFSRDSLDSLQYERILNQNGVELISVNEKLENTPEGVLMKAIINGMNEFYSLNLAREVMKGLKENAYNAKHTGGIPPLGYDVDNDMNYIINEKEAAAVKLIFNMYVNGSGYTSIISALNSSGYRTKRGNTFGKNSLYEILKNEKYTGTFIYNKTASKNLAGKHNRHKYKDEKDIIKIENGTPKIISKEMFNEVQKMMEQNKRKNARHKAKAFYLLSGLLYCGECKGALTGDTRRYRDKVYSYYSCSRQKRDKTCNMKPIRKEIIDDAVIDNLNKKIFSKKVVRNICARIYESYRENDIHEKITFYEKEIRSLNFKIGNLQKAIEDGLNAKETMPRINELAAEKNLIELKLIELKTIPEPEKKSLEELIQEFSKWNLADLSEQNQKALIQRFVQKIFVYDGGKKIRVIINPNRIDLNGLLDTNGGEGEIRTLAPVSRPTPLAGAPLRPT